MKRPFILLIVILASALLTSCVINRSRMVTFSADAGSGTVFGNYLISGELIPFDGEASPWSVDVATDKNDFVLLTVAIDSGSTSLTARVYVDNVLFAEESGTDFDFVQVGGWIP